jgi:hypothetical protein
MYRVLNIMLGMLLVTGAARASPYWIEYDPASGSFPEEVAWTRYALGGGAQRYFEDAALVLDDAGSTTVTDAYAWFRPGELDPGPQEVFSAQWRLCVDQLDGPFDPVVGIYSDDRRAVEIDLSWDSIHIPGEGFVATFEPGLFHEFEVRSADMLAYDLYLDGTLTYSGFFSPPALNASLVAWGDAVLGAASVTHWDYFKVSVTPEPCTVWLVLPAFLVRLKPRG